MYPEHLKYTTEHEWIDPNGDAHAVGITAFAAEQLGDVTYVELPEVGKEVAAHEEIATVESVKAASDIYAPVGGKIAAANGALDDKPELINESPYEKGWFFKIEGVDASEFDQLMDRSAYEAFIAELDE